MRRRVSMGLGDDLEMKKKRQGKARPLSTSMGRTNQNQMKILKQRDELTQIERGIQGEEQRAVGCLLLAILVCVEMTRMADGKGGGR